MQFLIILAIFLVPIASIITIKGTCVWYPQLLALELIGGFFFASRFWKLNKFLTIFISYLFFSYIFIANAEPRTMMCLFIGCMACLSILVTSEIENLKWIYISLISLSLLNGAYAILQSFGLDPIFVPIGNKFEGVVGFMGSHNQLGIYSATNAFWNPWMMLFSIIPIFLAKSNAGLMGLVFGTLIYLYFVFGRKKMFAFLFGILILLVPWWHFCHKSGQELNERFKLWKLTTGQILEGRIESYDLQGNKSIITCNPLFGFGLGKFFTFSPFSQYKMWGLNKTDPRSGTKDGSLIQQHFYEHAHNDILEVFYEFGYLGLVIVVAIVVSLVFVFASSPKSLGVVTTFSSLIAQSVASMSVYVFHAPVSLFMFCLTIGLFYAEVKNAKST